MKRINWIVCAMLAVGGCSQGVSVDNANPTGTVAGIVLDATSEAPLMGPPSPSSPATRRRRR